VKALFCLCLVVAVLFGALAWQFRNEANRLRAEEELKVRLTARNQFLEAKLVKTQSAYDKLHAAKLAALETKLSRRKAQLQTLVDQWKWNNTETKRIEQVTKNMIAGKAQAEAEQRQADGFDGGGDYDDDTAVSGYGNYSGGTYSVRGYTRSDGTYVSGYRRHYHK
jgi:hypothetical protein